MSGVKKRILCVDDNHETCDLLEVVLADYEFAAVPTIGGGWELIRGRPFDMYLLDNWLPDGSGIDLCRQIRGVDCNAPIVFLSAAAYKSDHQLAMSAGASAYLDKPINPLTLESTVARLIDKAGADSLEARLAEVAAIREAVADRILGLDKRLTQVKKRLTVANDYLLKAQAYRAFIASWGYKSVF